MDLLTSKTLYIIVGVVILLIIGQTCLNVWKSEKDFVKSTKNLYYVLYQEIVFLIAYIGFAFFQISQSITSYKAYIILIVASMILAYVPKLILNKIYRRIYKSKCKKIKKYLVKLENTKGKKEIKDYETLINKENSEKKYLNFKIENNSTNINRAMTYVLLLACYILYKIHYFIRQSDVKHDIPAILESVTEALLTFVIIDTIIVIVKEIAAEFRHGKPKIEKIEEEYQDEMKKINSKFFETPETTTIVGEPEISEVKILNEQQTSKLNLKATIPVVIAICSAALINKMRKK